MKLLNTASALALASQAAAALVTQVLDVTQVIHRDAVVMVDNSGIPWTTSYKEVTSYYTASAPRATPNTETIVASSSSAHVHSSSVVEITVPTSSKGYTTVTLTKTLTLGSSSATDAAADSTDIASSAANYNAVPSVSSVAAVVSSEDAAAVKETSSSSYAAVASSSVPAATGSVFSGQGTYYSVGLGACGWTNYDYDMVVALNAAQFGSQSNGNPVCGSRIVLTGPKGNSITVTVVDKCPGCAHGSLDLSPSAFQELASLDDGRIDISWYFA